MLYSTCQISLCILLLIKSSISSRYSRLHNKFYPPIETKSLSRQETDNLKLMLNFIRESPEFRPLTFSVILPEFQSRFVDFLIRYLGENSIEAYKVRARDLSLKATWMNRVGLTWIIVVQDLYSLNIFIYWQRKLWKTRNQYLIIFEGVNFSWRNAFRNLWMKYSVYRAIVIPMDDNFRYLMRYMPFEVSKDGFGEVHRLCLKKNSTGNSNKYVSYQCSLKNGSSEDLSEDLPSNTGSMLFENFQNLNNYPVNVIVFESLLMNVSYDDQNRLKLEKPDANVMFSLEKTMRAKFRIKATRKIDFWEDPFTSSLRSIENGDVEMIITGFFVKEYSKFKKFQFTRATYEDKQCFLSPDSGIVPKAYMPFLPFQINLWVLLIAYNIVITLLWRFVKYISESWQHKHSIDLQSTTINRLNKKPETGEQSIKHLSRITKVFFFVENLCYPLQNGETPTQKALLFGTLFFGLVVNGLYQSSLVSSLSKPLHYPQLHTLEDVIDSGKVVVTKYANLKNVFTEDFPQDKKLSERIHVINIRRSTKEIVAYENKIALTRYYTMKLENFAYYDKEGNSLIYVVDECPMNYRLSYVLRLHSPYAERVDFLLLRMREAGFINFWLENVIHPIKITNMRRKLNMEKRRIKLTLDHYSLSFLLLFVGLFGSAMMFFGEIYAAKRSTRRD